MTSLAFTLVLAAALAHAGWNLLAKRAQGATGFNFLFTLFSVVLYLPLGVGVMVFQRPRLGPSQFGFMAGSVLFQTLYFFLLFRGYRSGDLSLVYPLARSTGPLLAVVAAIVFFNERPSALALGGAALILIGVFLMAGGPSKIARSGSGRAVFFALLTGAVIASYTLWDKQAVSALTIPPILLCYAQSLGRLILLTPYAWRRSGEVRAEWVTHRRSALAVAVLEPLAYILVLTALSFSPVSYVAPAREVSILIGAVLGTRFLAEGEVKRRLPAAAAMVVGVAAMALG